MLDRQVVSIRPRIQHLASIDEPMIGNILRLKGMFDVVDLEARTAGKRAEGDLRDVDHVSERHWLGEGHLAQRSNSSFGLPHGDHLEGAQPSNVMLGCVR